MIKRQRAIISSMTPDRAAQSRHPEGLAQEAHRGRLGHAKVEEVNRLLKQHRQMADMMKSLGGAAGGKRGALGKMASACSGWARAIRWPA